MFLYFSSGQCLGFPRLVSQNASEMHLIRSPKFSPKSLPDGYLQICDKMIWSLKEVVELHVLRTERLDHVRGRENRYAAITLADHYCATFNRYI